MTKEFYKELQAWYFYALDKIRFPEDYKYSDDPQKNREVRNATNLIRLLTRVIFAWFMRERNLIPEDIFDENKLKGIVKDFLKDENSSNYYNAILQNLFFATLNQKPSERAFASDGGEPYNPHYGVKTLYRYADKFLISKEDILKLFKNVPFLNGGLFDCLDKEDYYDEKKRVIYIDGFSRNPKKRAVIPDYLFFNKNEIIADLSQYGLGKNEKVRGLFTIFRDYNWTTDEASPVDKEIALDPELLGKVFENLLASYNPETHETARRATGSYYTPREIVDFMVDTTLVEYLKNKCPEVDEEKIKLLLSYSEEIPTFSEEERAKLLEAIDNAKIIDTACGSGAFLMGALHKLVHILERLDPDNKHWKELQRRKIREDINHVFESHETDEEIKQALKELNEIFDESLNYPNYSRKLYLIENCIYGVDIQPIAVQISKLRFFISLILDQMIDPTKENLGIRPLPNLETKFVAANTLIGLQKQGQITLAWNIERYKEELRNLRHKYFTAKTRTRKIQLQQKDRDLREQIKKELLALKFSEEDAEKIASFDPFDQNSSADWFDPEWMFGVKDGFDLVIGNPPYIQLQKAIEEKKKYADLYKSQGFETFDRMGDIYCLFYEKGMQILKENGILTFITSNKWMRAGYGEKLRAFFLKYNPKVLIDLGPGVFESATVDTCILMIQKRPNENKLKAVTVTGENIRKGDLMNLLETQSVVLAQLTK
ncbi:MAG: Eco57I restriction-modification methylase domain-containing protein, partial [Fervidobacterium pennivorans]